MRIDYSWGGAVDRAPGHLPFVGHLGDHENILYGLGFSGNGVGPSALIGRILGRRALAMNDEDTKSPIATGPRAYLPPEPLRSVGGAMVRWGASRTDDKEELGEVPGLLARVLSKLVAASVPRPIEPRLGVAHTPIEGRRVIETVHSALSRETYTAVAGGWCPSAIWRGPRSKIPESHPRGSPGRSRRQGKGVSPATPALGERASESLLVRGRGRPRRPTPGPHGLAVREGRKQGSPPRTSGASADRRLREESSVAEQVGPKQLPTSLWVGRPR